MHLFFRKKKNGQRLPFTISPEDHAKLPPHLQSQFQRYDNRPGEKPTHTITQQDDSFALSLINTDLLSAEAAMIGQELADVNLGPNMDTPGFNPEI